MAETVFSMILRGDLPCHKVYEDEHVLAFLDINPLSPGHTLVIPKEPAVTIDALSDESAAAIGRVLPRISRAVMKATGTQEYNLLQNNGFEQHVLTAVPLPHISWATQYDDVLPRVSALNCAVLLKDL